MLNQRQENFCLNIVKGMSQVDAYKKAGYGNGDRTVAIRNASRLVSKDNIKQRIAELRKPVVTEILSSSKRAAIYSKMADLDIDFNVASTDQKLKAKLESLNRLNMMEHVYSDAPSQDNRTYNLVFINDNDKANEAIKRITEGSTDRAESSPDRHTGE